jgi:hypothetical protein
VLGIALALASSRAATSELLVTSVPPRAKVQLDGRSIGRTPLQLRAIPRGRYKLRVTLRGFRPFAQLVEVGEGDSVRVEATLLQTGPRRGRGGMVWAGRIAVSAGLAAQVTGRHFSNSWSDAESTTQTLTNATDTRSWKAALDNTYSSVSSPVAPDLGVQLRISKQLALEVSGQRYKQGLASEVAWSSSRKQVYVFRPPCSPSCGPTTTSTTDLPNPQESGTASGLSYGLAVLGVALHLKTPLARHIDLELSAGPAIFSAKLDVLRDLHGFDACRSVWPDRIDCTVGYGKATERRSALGAQFGMALAFHLSEQLELVAGMRAGSAGSLTVGGLSTAEPNRRVKDYLAYYTATDHVAQDEILPIKLGTASVVPRLSLRWSF